MRNIIEIVTKLSKQLGGETIKNVGLKCVNVPSFLLRKLSMHICSNVNSERIELSPNFPRNQFRAVLA